MVKDRPNTSTLSKPRLLNPKWLGLLDMSKISSKRELAGVEDLLSKPEIVAKPAETAKILNKTYKVKGKKQRPPVPLLAPPQQPPPPPPPQHPNDNIDCCSSCGKPKDQPAAKAVEGKWETKISAAVSAKNPQQTASKSNSAKTKAKTAAVVAEEGSNSSETTGTKFDLWAPTPMTRSRKVFCYLCAQEMESSALPTHEILCLQKWVKFKCGEESGKIANEDFSSEENWEYALEHTKASLVPCHHCYRKFMPNRLETHEKNCIAKKEDYKEIPKHPGITCDICGKKFGTKSITIHRKQCEEKLAKTVAAEKAKAAATAAPVVQKQQQPKGLLRKWKFNKPERPVSSSRLPVPRKTRAATEDVNKENYWKTGGIHVPCGKKLEKSDTFLKNFSSPRNNFKSK